MLRLETLEDRLLLSADLVAISRADPALIADTASGQNSQLSRDGRYVVFESAMDNLTPGDTNGQLDVFLFDRMANTVLPISRKQTGTGTGNAPSRNARISDDGRFIAFESTATDLTGTSLSPNQLRLFVYARETGTMQVLVDGQAVGGVPSLLALSGNGDSAAVLLNGQIYVAHRPGNTFTLVTHQRGQPTQPDGGFLDGSVSFDTAGDSLAFAWFGGNLVQTSTTGAYNVFLYNRVTDQVSLVSHDPGRTASANGNSTQPRLSADGTALVFQSDATNLSNAEEGNLGSDVFLYNRAADTVQLVSHQSGNTRTANQVSHRPTISDDGQFVAFESAASDLDTVDINGANFSDVFLWSRANNQVRIIDPATPSRTNPIISGDGRYVAFLSDRSTSSIPAFDAYRFDRQTGNVTLVTPNLQGSAAGDRDLDELAISRDGRYVAFHSTAADLVARDTNDAPDLFLRDVTAGSTTAASRRHPTLPKTTGVGQSALRSGELFDSVPRRRVSDDGRYVVFQSDADNLTLNDHNQRTDVFLFDRQLQQMTLVSRTATGSGTGASGNPALSGDGRYVVFESQAEDLVASDGNARTDVFLFDRVTGTVRLVSRNQAGTGGGNGDSGNPTISQNGQVIAFESGADDLVNNAGGVNVYLYDPATSAVTLASRRANGSGSGTASNPDLSSDGSLLVFEDASALVAGDINGVPDVYLYQRAGGVLTQVSVGGNGASGLPRISGDGQFVTFESRATNLVPGTDINGAQPDVFLFAVQPRTMTLVSRNLAGTGSGAASSTTPRLSADGRFVVFLSNANNLAAGDAETSADVFLYDRVQNTLTLVSRDLPGVPGQANPDASDPSISGDGRLIAFASTAVTLVGQTDVNGNIRDIFLFDREADQVSLVSRSLSADTTANDNSDGAYGLGHLSLSATGNILVFVSHASDLVIGDYGRTGLEPDATVLVREQDVFARRFNRAPILTQATPLVVPSLNQNDTNNAGILVRDLLAQGGDPIQDADNDPEGIALVAASSQGGMWQFSLNDGQSWIALGSPTATAARLLAADNSTRIRFVPDGSFRGTINPGLTFRAWDQCEGTNGGLADVTHHGGITPFSIGTATTAITIAANNQAPTAFDQRLSVPVNQQLAITLTGDDGDPQVVQQLTFTIVTGPQHGVLSGFSPQTGAVLYTPNPGYHGPDSFTFKVADDATGGGSPQTSLTATITIGVSAPPTISTIPDTSGLEDQIIGPLPFTINDVETPADSLKLEVETSNPALVPLSSITIEGSGSDRALRVRPVAEGFGTVTLTLTVQDLDGAVASTVVTLTVQPVNDAPMFTPGPEIRVAASAGAQSFAGWATGLKSGPVNESGQTLRFVVNTDRPDLFIVPPALALNGTLSFVPQPNQSGTATVTIVLEDDGGTTNGGQNRSTTSTTRIILLPDNQPPQVRNEDRRLDEDGSLTLLVSELLANDFPGPENESGQTLTLIEVTTAAHGQVSFDAVNGTIRYVPAKDYTGTDQFSYTVRDNGTKGNQPDPQSAVGTVFLQIAPVNDAPVLAVPGRQNMAMNDTLTLAIGVQDVDAQELEVVLAGQNGSVSVDPVAGVQIERSDSNLLLRGAPAALQAALQNTRFTPQTRFTGSAQVVVTTNDLGSSGSGGVRSEQKVIEITVTTVDALAVYVQCLYQELLNRSAEPAGVEYWSRVLQSGVAREQVVAAIWESPEHRGQQVDDYYQRFLKRAADPGGRSFWLQAYGQGATDDQIIEGFFFSPEYQATHVAAEAFVNGLYEDLLGRPADAAGFSYWLQVLHYFDQQGSGGRTAVAQGFLNAAEYHRQLLDRYYQEILHRPPDPAGLQYWIAVLQGRYLDATDVAEHFLGSEEYFQTC